MRAPERLAIGRLLGWVAAITTTAVVPWGSYDPINVPKLAVMSAGGFMALAFVVSQWRLFRGKTFRTPLIIASIFVFDLILVLIFAGVNFNQEFFGTNGRATGFVAYVALTGLFLIGVVASSRSILKRHSWFLIGSGALSTVYGVMQANGLEPANWVSGYSPVIGFVGNPDFQSSFVAFSAVMAMTMLANKEMKPLFKAGLIAYIAVVIYVIKETKAQQGYLVLLGGSAVIALIYVYKSKAKAFTLPLMGAGFVGLVLVVMGSLNSGPLASILHKASVVYRGDYWRAGWKMTLDHPFLGVGLDSYGDWYRRSRTLEATLRRGPDVTSNAAHNVLLDFSSNGGFPLLIIYLALMALVVRAAFRVIQRSSNFEPVFTGLFAVWIAYQAQSVISLNQLGLAVWGWIISGLIIGYEINGRNEIEDVKIRKLSKNDRTALVLADQKVLPITSVALFIGLLIGLLVGLPPLIASSKFKSALESGDKTVITNAVNIFPQDVARTNQIAYIFQQNKLEAEVLGIITTAVKNYPDSYDAWKLLASLSNATSVQVSEAKAQMKRLDPHNPDLK